MHDAHLKTSTAWIVWSTRVIFQSNQVFIHDSSWMRIFEMNFVEMYAGCKNDIGFGATQNNNKKYTSFPNQTVSGAREISSSCHFIWLFDAHANTNSSTIHRRQSSWVNECATQCGLIPTKLRHWIGCFSNKYDKNGYFNIIECLLFKVENWNITTDEMIHKTSGLNAHSQCKWHFNCLKMKDTFWGRG